LSGEDSTREVVLNDDAADDKVESKDSTVFEYFNDKLKKYGYDPVDFVSKEKKPSSNDDEETTTSSEQQENSSNDENDGEQEEGGQQDDSEEDSSESSDEGSGSEVPQDGDGPPAESVEGKDLTFGIDFGFG
jgi:hypothetical protein